MSGPIWKLGICIVLLLATVCGLTGCWSKEEMNDRTFATVMMADLTEDGQTELTLGFFLPNRLTTGQSTSVQKDKPYTILNQTGRNLAEAYQKIQREVPRRITWGAMRIIIIGDRYAQSGVQPLAEFLNRMPEIRLTCNIFYYNGVAKEMGQTPPIFERFPSEVMREYAHMKMVPSLNVKDLLYSLENNLGDGYIPELTMSYKQIIGQDRKKDYWLGNAGAILLKNGKKAAAMTIQQSHGLQWILNRVDEVIETVPSPTDGKPISVRLHGEKRHLSLREAKGRLDYKLDIQAEASLLTSDSDLVLADQKAADQLEQVISQQIRKHILIAWAAAKKNKSDAFGWSEYVRWKYPQLWWQWKRDNPDNFTMKSDVQAAVSVKLIRIGASRMSIYTK